MPCTQHVTCTLHLFLFSSTTALLTVSRPFLSIHFVCNALCDECYCVGQSLGISVVVHHVYHNFEATLKALLPSDPCYACVVHAFMQRCRQNLPRCQPLLCLCCPFSDCVLALRSYMTSTPENRVHIGAVGKLISYVVLLS